MPSPLTPSSANGVKKRRVIPDAWSSTTTTDASGPSPSNGSSHPPNSSRRSSIVVPSASSSPAPSPEKKPKRNTVGSLRKLFGGNSTRASFDFSEGQGGGGSGQDDHTSVKSGRASSSEDRHPAPAGSGAGSTNEPAQDPKDVAPSPESERDPPVDPPSHPSSPPPPAPIVGETKTDTHHHHTCREPELQQSLSAVQLELQRLKERVRLLSAENDGYKKEVVDKHKELEERETTVLELKLDVELEREKVKKVIEEGVILIGSGSSLKERGVTSRSSSLMMAGLDLGTGFKLPETENGHGPVVLVEDGGVTTDWSEDTHVADGTELVQEPAQATIEPAGASIPVDTTSVSSFALTKVDVATNTEREESETSEPNEEPELLALKDALDRQTKALADLASMNDSNSTIKQRHVKFNGLRSQLVLLVEQTNLEAVRLHKELDRSATWFLALVFSIFIFGLFMILLLCLYKFLLEHNYVPTIANMIPSSPSS